MSNQPEQKKKPFFSCCSAEEEKKETYIDLSQKKEPVRSPYPGKDAIIGSTIFATSAT